MVSEMEAWPGHRRHRQRLDHWTRQMLGPRGLGSQRHEALAQSFGARFATRREPQGGALEPKMRRYFEVSKKLEKSGEPAIKRPSFHRAADLDLYQCGP